VYIESYRIVLRVGSGNWPTN